MDRTIYWGVFAMPANPTTDTSAQFVCNVANGAQIWPKGSVLYAQLDGGEVQAFPCDPRNQPVYVNYSGLSVGSHDCKLWVVGTNVNPESGDFVWEIVSA